MSRNLASSFCVIESCTFREPVRLSDLRGAPIEFRRYGPYKPTIGTRWDCPGCGTAYFVSWRDGDSFWGSQPDPQVVYATELHGHPNRERGRFVVARKEHGPLRALLTGQAEDTTVDLPLPDGSTLTAGETRLENTGHFTLDLSFYESFNDEQDTTCRYQTRERDQVPAAWADYVDGSRVDDRIGWCAEHDVPYHSGHERPVARPDVPRHLCLDDAADVQWVWGHPPDGTGLR